MRALFHILLFVVAVALPGRADATSAEGAWLDSGVVPVAASVVRADDDATDEAPDLSAAYSSLYATEAERKRNERRAFRMGIAGSLLGLLAGGLGAVLTVGVGSVAVPFAGAVGAAWGVQPFFEARYGWIFTGAMIGMATAVPIGIGMGVIAASSGGFGGAALAILFAVFIGVIAPSAGATIAGITDQDNIERRGHRWKVAVAPVEGPRHDGVGLSVRF